MQCNKHHKHSLWQGVKYINLIMGHYRYHELRPMTSYFPLSLGSFGWFSKYMSYEDWKDFVSNKCSIWTRYLHFNTISFPNQQWYNKSTYDLVERLLSPLSFYRRYLKFKERYLDMSKFRMIFNNLIYLSSI